MSWWMIVYSLGAGGRVSAALITAWVLLTLCVGIQWGHLDHRRDSTLKMILNPSTAFSSDTTKDFGGRFLRGAVELKCFCPGTVSVCHHRDHCDFHLRWVPQVSAHTQTCVHSGLLYLLLHYGLPNDHTGESPLCMARYGGDCVMTVQWSLLGESL